MTEILNKSVVSNMQSLVDELVQQATETGHGYWNRAWL